MKIFNEYKDKGIEIFSINPIDRKGKIDGEYSQFKLPYKILVGTDTDIISLYQIDKLPKIVIINKQGIVTFTDKFAPYDKIKEEIEKILSQKK